jgi:hypothetical protein
MPRKPSSPVAAAAKALRLMRDAEDNGNRQNAGDFIYYLKLYGYRIIRTEEKNLP